MSEIERRVRDALVSLLDPVDPSPTLPPPALRRARIRIAAIVTAAAVVAGAAVASAVVLVSDDRDRAAPRPATSPGGEGPYLFLSGKYGKVWRVDPAGGVVHANVRELHPGDPPHHLLARGHELVGYGRHTYLLDPALREDPEVIARGSLFFLASAHVDRVWIATEDDDPRTRGVIATVREVTTDGDVTVGATRPPKGAWPEAAVESGLVLAPGGRRVVWDPEADEVVFRFPGPRGDLGPTRGNLVAWCAFGCKELHVTEVRSGADHGIGPPPGSRGFRAWDGAFSPDGTTVALPIRLDGPGKRVQLALVDVGSQTVTPIAGTVTDEFFNFVAWSASGSHVFFTGADGEDRKIFVYDTATRTARVVPAEVGGFYDATAI